MIRNKMALAIAKMLEINASNVILTFSSATLRRRDLLQQNGVLVMVGLTNFHNSVSSFTSKITSERINAAMAAEGLEAVQLITVLSTGDFHVVIIISTLK
jgi:hypothetical protein